MTALAHERDLARWYPLRDHPVQRALVEDEVRFKVVPAGRRSGKTERVKRYMARAAMQEQGNYFIAAPTRDQVKRIYWNDMKRLSFTSVLPDKPSESELIIKYPNGSTLSLIGLDQPQRMEGSFWTGGDIDEIADVKETAWAENISPALDTFNPERPDYRAWCILLGVPDGMNHYYDMAEYARTANDPDWKLYTWPSSDILPADLVDAARRRMSLRQFRQEYEASFETSTGRIYEDYSKANHTDAEIEPHEMLLWMHDFNYTPLSSAVGVVRDGDIFLLEEIVLVSAVAQQSALEFVDRYKDHENKHVRIYGDPSGRAGEKHGHESDYTAIEAVLRDHGWSYSRQVQYSTRSIKDGQNAVRAKIANAAGEVSLFVNPNSAPYVHKSLATGTLKKGSTFLEEDGEYQHIGTAVRYFVDTEFPIEENYAQPARTRGGL
jgi:hypothetical protein